MRYRQRKRPGAAMIEMAIVLPVVIVLLGWLVVCGLGIYRYQQMAALAREGARYACVHGTQYAADTGNAAATAGDVYNQAILPMAVGLDPAKLSYSVSWDASNSPTRANASSTPPGQPVANKVIVTVTYQWIPEYFLGGVTLTSRAEMPMAR